MLSVEEAFRELRIEADDTMGIKLMAVAALLRQLQDSGSSRSVPQPAALKRFSAEQTARYDAALEEVGRLRASCAANEEHVRLLKDGKVMVVDAGKCGHFRSVTDALRAAVPSDIVVVRPGTYRENIECSATGIALLGGQTECTVLEGVEDKPVLALTGENIRVARLTVRQPSRTAPCVRLDGTPTLEDCALESPATTALLVRKGTSRLKRCTVQRCGHHGVHVRKDARAELTGCDVSYNRYGMYLEPHSTTNITQCTVAFNRRNGVYLQPQATALIADSLLKCNADSNVDIEAGAHAILRGSEIVGSEKCGVCFAECATGLLERCRVSGNQYSNVVVMAGATATLQHNDISDSRQHGVYVHRGATAFIRHNHLHGNQLNELKVDDGSSVIHSANTHPVPDLCTPGPGDPAQPSSG